MKKRQFWVLLWMAICFTSWKSVASFVLAGRWILLVDIWCGIAENLATCVASLGSTRSPSATLRQKVWLFRLTECLLLSSCWIPRSNMHLVSSNRNLSKLWLATRMPNPPCKTRHWFLDQMVPALPMWLACLERVGSKFLCCWSLGYRHRHFI